MRALLKNVSPTWRSSNRYSAETKKFISDVLIAKTAEIQEELQLFTNSELRDLYYEMISSDETSIQRTCTIDAIKNLMEQYGKR
jgi:hypothetical protein